MSRISPLHWAFLAGLLTLPVHNVADASVGESPGTAQKEKKKDSDKKKSGSKDKDKKKDKPAKDKDKDKDKKKDKPAKDKDKGKKKDSDKKKSGSKDKDKDKPAKDKDKPAKDKQETRSQTNGNNGPASVDQANNRSNVQKKEPRKAPNPGPRSVATHKRPEIASKPKATKRSYDPRKKAGVPLHRTRDHRYARPRSHRLTHHARAAHPPPRFRPYRPYYSRWWIHPFFRWQHATLRIVLFPFTVAAWTMDWAPPARPGWTWVPGFHVGPVWHPGHWRPVATRPVVYASVSYLYVPGWWEGENYVEGYYRPEERQDGDWEWVEGYYLDDGVAVRGHWVPAGEPPQGMTWEAGFFDGEEWVEGFWRPAQRTGHRWISSYYDGEGIYHSGYWEPIQAQAGAVWVPGWFDGNAWQEGYWVPTEEYESVDLASWEPEPGFDAGWEDEPEEEDALTDAGPPLAMPVTFADEDFED